VIAGITALLLKSANINLFRFQQVEVLRTCFVIAMILYLLAALFSVGKKVEIPLIVSIPFLTQFYQVSLGWEVIGGATSPWRLAPFLVMAVAMLGSIIIRQYRIKNFELACMSAYIFICIIALINSAAITPIGFTCFFLVAVLIPLFYMYSGCLVQSLGNDIRLLFLSVTIGYFILILGSIGTFKMALGIDIAEGAGTYRGTQNVVDMNSIFSYLLLSWPFSFLYLKRHNPKLVIPQIILTILVVLLGFSRTAFLFTPIIIFLSLMTYSLRKAVKIVLTLALATTLAFGLFFRWFNLNEITSSWGRRFDLNNSTFDQIKLSNFFEPLKSGSRDYAIRKEIRAEAMRLFLDRPFFGHGWGSFQELSLVGQTTAHNLTLNILVETGILGAILLWLLILKIFLSLQRLYCKGFLSKKKIMLVFGLLLIWLIVGHTMGSSLFLASREGFQVNAITGLLFVLLVRRDILEFIVQKDLRRDQS
jgi:O-antigen ligase